MFKQTIPDNFCANTKIIKDWASVHTFYRNNDFSAISVTYSEAAPRRSQKWNVKYRIVSVPHFGVRLTCPGSTGPKFFPNSYKGACSPAMV